MKKTIIFDFDGTIADSFTIVVSIIQEMMHRSQKLTPEEIIGLKHMHLLEVAKKEHLPVWRIPFMVIRGRRMMNSRIGEVRLFDGMGIVIKELYDSGYELFIVSSNSSVNIEKFLQSNKLKQYFAKIYGGVGLFSKSRMLRKTLGANKLSPDKCIYVGDEARDVKASKEVGMRCVSVGWGFNAASLLCKLKPMAIADRPEDLLEIIRAKDS
jgi:phosphoglycolate phosphatase-like HAD superfamily hydrolase